MCKGAVHNGDDPMSLDGGNVLFNTVLFTGNANPALAQEIAAFSLKHGIPCHRVSAKTGDGVAEAYEVLARNCLKVFGKTNGEGDKNSVVDDIRKKKAEFKLKSGQQEQQKKKCC